MRMRRPTNDTTLGCRPSFHNGRSCYLWPQITGYPLAAIEVGGTNLRCTLTHAFLRRLRIEGSEYFPVTILPHISCASSIRGMTARIEELTEGERPMSW